jgi:hypothetical protein
MGTQRYRGVRARSYRAIGSPDRKVGIRVAIIRQDRGIEGNGPGTNPYARALGFGSWTRKSRGYVIYDGYGLYR